MRTLRLDNTSVTFCLGPTLGRFILPLFCTTLPMNSSFSVLFDRALLLCSPVVYLDVDFPNAGFPQHPD